MTTTCIRHTELPNTSRLFADLVYHFDRVSSFYAHAPYDPESFAAAAKQIEYPAERRAAMVAALAEQNPGNPSLEILARDGAVAVVTGQQVGLFSGPCYSIFKALSAIRLAENLTAQGIPAVPVFWLATEDHDLVEINQAWVFNAAHEVVGLQTAAVNPLGGPVGPIPVGVAPLDELAAALAGLPFAEEVMAMVRECYAPGATFGGAFRALAQKLLAKWPILFLDPLAPAVRAIGSSFILKAVAEAPELNAALLRRNQELAAAGYHAQVHVEAGGSLLFSLEGGKRTPWAGEPVRTADLSPNALLRPVLQDYLLPTVAYFGGPAELAYFAQSEVLYKKLLGRMPVMLHRAGFTLLDDRTAKILHHYGLSVVDTLIHETGLRERLAAKLIPAGITEKVAALRTHLGTEVEALYAEVRALDPTLEKVLAKSSAKMIYQLGKMERKTARQALRRDEQAQRQTEYLHHSLYPHRHMQERFYSILPFLAQHGPDLIERIYEHVEVDCPDHQVLPIH
jgi:bacillithiol synthase